MDKKVNRFEDLVVWQMSRKNASMVYGLFGESIRKKDYGFYDQIRRAAVSVMNNVAEGYERGSNIDFAKFLFIARGSCGEVRSMLYVALDQKYISQDDFDALSDECRKCSAGIWNLIRSLKKKSGWIEKAQIALISIFFTL